MPESVLKLFDKRVLCHGQKRFLTILLAVLLHADSAGPILSILSDDELPHPSTLLLDTSFTVPLPPRTQLYHRSCSNKHTHDTTIPWPVKRSRGFTGEYVKPTTTSRRNAAPLTIHETEQSALTNVSLSPVARVTHGLGTHNGGSPTDASPSQPDTKRCIQVGRDTYAVTSQPGTSYTFDPGIDTGTCQGQRLQPVTNPDCDDYDSILVIDSSEPRMQPTTTTNTKKTNRTPHGKHAKAQAGAWRRK